MPKTKAQKRIDVAELTEKLRASKSVVLANYQGMTMVQLSELRLKLADQDAEFSVTKNNLLKIALKDADYEGLDDSALAGATATLMSFGDEILPIKTLAKAIKDNQIGSVKSGFLNRSILTGKEIELLATLPSKDELRGKLVGTLGAPLYGIVGVLQANLRNLVYVLNEIKSQASGRAT